MTTTSTPQPVALVTGGTSGIGVSIAQQLSRDGFLVVVTGRSQQRGADVVAQLPGAGHLVVADLTTETGVQQVIDGALEAFGRIDVLVNNAAIDHTNDLLEVEDAEIRHTFETNTFAAMNLLIAAARHMRERGGGGSIINITSRLAHIGVPTMGIYSASKGAMLAFTKAAAIDLAEHNIRVNAVAPGMTRTPLYDEWLQGLPDPEAEAKKVAAAVPMQRIAEPEDVAHAVSYLASPGAAYITGTTIPVEGGYLAK